MRVGFTGTRKGMSSRQRRRLAAILQAMTEIHHGDCVGADEQAHELATETGIRRVVHPPDKPWFRAWCGSDDGSTVLPEKPYLARNRDIVDACDVLIAAPFGPEKIRSGTWSTVRYARKIGKATRILERS